MSKYVVDIGLHLAAISVCVFKGMNLNFPLYLDT